MFPDAVLCLGPTGLPGADSDGSAGQQGTLGNNGEDGNVGQRGDPGPPGESGPVGNNGDKGPVGETGDTGYTGEGFTFCAIMLFISKFH